jgi:hypothetical protein
MRAVLIDPYNRTVSFINLPHNPELESIYKVLEVEWIESIHIGDDERMFIDEEGLMHINDKTRFFVWNTPLDTKLIAGRGLILSTDLNGDVQSTAMTPEIINRHVRFVDDNVKAADLAERMLDSVTVCTTPAEYKAACDRMAKLMEEALTL